MPYDRFLIAPINTGWQDDLRPWLIPDDAFPQLNNAYVFRGRVRKRFGGILTGNGAPSAVIASYYSRLAINIGTTDGAGNISVTVPGHIFGPGQAFTIGTEIFTVYQTGAPAVMLDTGAATVKTYNTTTGAVVIHGAAAMTAVYFYPAQPVMGLDTYDQTGVSVNDQPAYAEDTQFIYTFNSANGFWIRSGTAVFHAGNNQFFWSANWRGANAQDRAFFVTNNFALNPNGAIDATDDPIWYTKDGSTWTSLSGANAFYFAPAGGAIHTGPYVLNARIIVGFKDRLVLLNTIEVLDGANNTQFVNRARWSHNGSPFSTNAWYEQNQTDAAGNVGDGGGFLNAPTDEQIISADFIKDRLIVYFESSTWELAWTSNTALPFQWQKINTELGSEALLSTVPFDRHILTMGNVGVHACNGSNVERIDNKIPDEIFKIRNLNIGVDRVAGIRDYFNELVYWTFPSDNETSTQTFPNKVLVYNYRNGTWALNDDCITVFGYFNQQINQAWNSQFDLQWEDADFAWDEATEQAQNKQVIAGNQEGYVFIVNADISRNAPVMQITNMVNSGTNLQLTMYNHNLSVGDFIAIENAQGVTGIIAGLNDPVISIVDANNVIVGPLNIGGTYTGGGTATRVSNIGILSKQFNPYIDKDRSVYVQKIDFGVQRTTNGQVTIDFYTSASELSLVAAGTETGSIVGTSILETNPYVTVSYEQEMDRLWHALYFQASGQSVQILIYMNQEQMAIQLFSLSDFQLEGMTLYTKPMSYRLQQ